MPFMDRFLEPLNLHDVDGALALMADERVWGVTRGREPHGTLYTGGRAVAPRSWRRSRRSLVSTNNLFGILSARTMSWRNVTGTLDDSSKARFHARASADMAFIPAVYR
jgi:hypothetical protein